MKPRNRSLIYYIVIVIFFLLALWYAGKGYHYHKSLPEVQNTSDLLGRILTPFVIAIIRFLIVTILGIFVANYIIAKPLKRLKVLSLELEFSELKTEIAQIQEMQLNKFHFVTSLLAQKEYFISKVLDSEEIPYKKVISDVLKEYGNFLSAELGENISGEVFEYEDDKKEYFFQPEYNRLVINVAEDEKSKAILTRKNFFGDRNIMMASTKEFEGINCIVCITSDNHEFTDYDIEILKIIFEICKTICETAILAGSE